MIAAINWCSFVRHHYLERENNNEPRDGSYISVLKLKVWWRNIRFISWRKILKLNNNKLCKKNYVDRMITLFLLKQTIITFASKTQLDTTYSRYGSLEEQYPEKSLTF